MAVSWDGFTEAPPAKVPSTRRSEALKTGRWSDTMPGTITKEMADADTDPLFPDDTPPRE